MPDMSRNDWRDWDDATGEMVLVSRYNEDDNRYGRPIIAKLRHVWETEDGKQLPVAYNDVWQPLPSEPEPELGLGNG